MEFIEEETDIKILRTKNYEKFSKIVGNREINPDRVKQILEAVQERNLLHVCPVIVNENYEIVDGQHRVEVAKILGEYIYYIKQSLKDDDMITLNINQRQWTIAHYINFYASRGNQNYIKFSEMQRKLNISAPLLFCFFGGKRVAIKNELCGGKFIYPGDGKAKRIEFIINKTRELIFKLISSNVDKEKINILTSTRFSEALAKLPANKDLNYFFDKLYQNISLLPKCSSVPQYLEVLNRICV